MLIGNWKERVVIEDFFRKIWKWVRMRGERLRWSVLPLIGLTVLMVGSGATRSTAEPVIRPRDAQVYDKFLQEFMPRDSEQRQHLALQILNAAVEQRIDPDLLFSLIAVESGFNSNARSSKGARGLGQVMPATARAVAPGVIRHPEDLYDVQRNLYVTALEVRRLLNKWAGDIRGALNEYTSGTVARRGVSQNPTRYVAKICMYYTLLKTKRDYYELLAKGEGPVQPARV